MPKLSIIPMEDEYPFGQEIRQNKQDTSCLVVKTCHCENPNDYERVQSQIAILKALKHKNLINLDHYLEEENSVHLYF
jgi:hypothetical protein